MTHTIKRRLVGRLHHTAAVGKRVLQYIVGCFTILVVSGVLLNVLAGAIGTGPGESGFGTLFLIWGFGNLYAWHLLAKELRLK